MILNNKLNRLKFLLFDLNGVIFTDNTKTASDENYCSAILDKLKNDLERAKGLNIELGVISASEDDKVINRLKAIGIKNVFSHSIDKVSQAEKLIKKYYVSYDEIGYIGDDILDIPLLSKVGFSATLKSARREVKRIVNYISRTDESKTVLQDVLELIKKARESVKSNEPGKIH